MEDRTPIYLMSIVGIVALVAVIYMFGGPSSNNSTMTQGNSITGNAVSDIEPVNYSGLGRFVVAIALIGACVYLYKTID